MHRDRARQTTTTNDEIDVLAAVVTARIQRDQPPRPDGRGRCTQLHQGASPAAGGHLDALNRGATATATPGPLSSLEQRPARPRTADPGEALSAALSATQAPPDAGSWPGPWRCRSGPAHRTSPGPPRGAQRLRPSTSGRRSPGAEDRPERPSPMVSPPSGPGRRSSRSDGPRAASEPGGESLQAGPEIAYTHLEVTLRVPSEDEDEDQRRRSYTLAPGCAFTSWAHCWRALTSVAS